MAEFAQLKVELAKALEAQTGSQSEQMNLSQRTSELVTKQTFICSVVLLQPQYKLTVYCRPWLNI